ncbi:MAG: DUF4263 domain-containing protein [Candidatus Obscuribacterales bacterium]|jgi:hypothetical protein|nr:DUF4263 domain-containing protein [Candidatus Obscuribacterales bacterium]
MFWQQLFTEEIWLWAYFPTHLSLTSLTPKQSVFGPALRTDFINTITPDIQKPVMIDISKTPRLAGAPTKEATLPAHFGAYDYVIIENRENRSSLP